MLTVERLREVLDYNPFTGAFTWAKTCSARAPAGNSAGVGAAKYQAIGIDNRLYRAHRLAWLYMHGNWPTGVIDHIDGNPKNNSIFNLRDVTQQVNTRNLKISKNSRSGVNGVNWNSKRQCWNAFIMINRKSINLGYFNSIPEAAAARKRFEQGLGFINRP